jgi:hypothetical protein
MAGGSDARRPLSTFRKPNAGLLRMKLLNERPYAEPASPRIERSNSIAAARSVTEQRFSHSSYSLAPAASENAASERKPLGGCGLAARRPPQLWHLRQRARAIPPLRPATTGASMCDCSSCATSAIAKYAVAPGAGVGRETELAALSAAAPARGWALARDYRASSTLPVERSFA